MGVFRSESLVARMRGLWVLTSPRRWLRVCTDYGVSPDDDDVMIKCVWINIIV